MSVTGARWWPAVAADNPAVGRARALPGCVWRGTRTFRLLTVVVSPFAGLGGPAMRSMIGLLLLFLTAPVPQAGAGNAPDDARAARPLRVIYDGRVFDATCALIHTEPSGNGLALYFVTSARLFKTADGGPFRPAAAVYVTLEDGTEIAVRREDIALPIGNLVDIAVLRAEVPNTTVAAGSMTFDPPAPASGFIVAGYDGDSAPATIAAHVRFASTRLIIGDRDASAIAGCIGAPALDDEGIFGVVSECDGNRAVVITPLSIAYAFIVRHVPGLVGRPTLRDHGQAARPQCRAADAENRPVRRRRQCDRAADAALKTIPAPPSLAGQAKKSRPACPPACRRCPPGPAPLDPGGTCGESEPMRTSPQHGSRAFRFSASLRNRRETRFLLRDEGDG